MIDKQFFKQYQKLILWFANSKIGKWFFQFEKMGHSLEYGKITAIFPNAIQHKVEENKYVTQFFGRAEYSLKIQRLFNWLPFNAVKFAKFDGQWVLQPKFGLTVSTFNPDADPESTSVDGMVRFTGTNADQLTSWNNTHNATTGTLAEDSTNHLTGSKPIACRHQSVGPNTTDINKGIWLFDTSSIPDTDNIDNAIFSLWTVSIVDEDNDGNDFTRLVTSTPASNTAIITADYDQLGIVAQANDIDFGNMSISQYNDWTLNATGEGNIDKTGITKFGLREGHDVLDDPIATDKNNTIGFYMADDSTNKPKLVVTHTPPETRILATVSNITSSVPAPTLSLGCTIQTTVLNIVSSVIDPLIKIIFRFKDKKSKIINMSQNKQPKIIELNQNKKPEMIKLDKDKQSKIIE